MSDITKPLSKFEALQLAIAATPDEIWNNSCYADDSPRIKYLFDLAEMIINEDAGRFCG